MGFFRKSSKDWYNEGTIKESTGGHQEAISCFNKAIELDPEYAKAWCNKAVSLQRIGKEQEAEDCFDKALDLNPAFTEAWYNKGNWLQELGRSQEAVICYDMVVKIDPNSDMAQYASKQKGLSQVILDLELPKEFSLLFFKGLRLRETGRHQEAISHLKKSIESIPPEHSEFISQIEELIRQVANN